MNCPECGGIRWRVHRASKREPTSVVRRKECRSCKFRISSKESFILPPLSIRKRDGSEEPLRREKLRASIEKAFGTPSLGMARVWRALEEWLETQLSGVIPTSLIGKRVEKLIAGEDELAGLRYGVGRGGEDGSNPYLKELREDFAKIAGEMGRNSLASPQPIIVDFLLGSCQSPE